MTDKDRRVFLDLLQEISERFDIQIYAYVLMSNHYHLLLKITETNLSKSMQWFGTTYTRRFHMHNQTGGHLFQGRYKAIIVENGAYLLRLSCYIHRNPLRAGIVNRLIDYPWSSYRFYAYPKRPPQWLDTGTILDQIQSPKQHPAYRSMVQNYSDEQNHVWEDVVHGFVYGSQAYIDKLKNRYLHDRKESELPQHNRLLADIDPHDLAQTAAQVFDLDLEALRTHRRVPAGQQTQRDMLIYYLWETGRMSNQTIASILGLTYSSVSRRATIFKTHMGNNKEIKTKYDDAKSQIKV